MRENRSIQFLESVVKAIVVKPSMIDEGEVLKLLHLVDVFDYKTAQVFLSFDGRWCIKGADRQPLTVFYYNPESLLCLDLKSKSNRTDIHLHITVSRRLPTDIDYNPLVPYHAYHELQGYLNKVYSHGMHDLIEIMESLRLVHMGESGRMYGQSIPLENGCSCMVWKKECGPYHISYFLGLEAPTQELELPEPVWSNIDGSYGGFL